MGTEEDSVQSATSKIFNSFDWRGKGGKMILGRVSFGVEENRSEQQR
jgi:hypothetical protein